jgi:uncharacterized protein (TIGR02266 family)
MPTCPACREELPSDSRFCGFCGFRLAPITLRSESSLLRHLTPAPPQAAPAPPEEAPILLTRKKRPSEEPARPKPKLLIVDERALEDTAPALTQTIADTEPAPPPSAPPPSALSASATGPARAETRLPPKAHKRTFQRFPLKVEVGFTSEHNFYTGFVQNLSSGGLFVATHTPSKVGEVLELSFSVPGLERPCTALCLVRWIREYDPLVPDMVPGMGLQFSQLEAEARAAIELFIQHREPIFFDDE